METKTPLMKGDRVEAADYRDALPMNTYAVLKKLHDTEGYMASHDGITAFADAVGRDRGAVYNEREKKHFRVSGNSLIEVNFTGLSDLFGNPLGETTDLGEVTGLLSPRWSQAVMPYSFTSQLIVTDQSAWIWDSTNGLLPYDDPNLGSPIDAIWINGYYFFTDREYLYHTDIANERVIQPTDFATSEFSPDPTLGLLKTQDNQVMVLNRYTTEYFYNDPQLTTAFAFRRVPAKAIDAGIVGTHLKTKVGGGVFCLGGSKDESPSMIILTPGRAENFSTREVDKIIAEYTEGELAGAGTMETRIENRNELVYVRLARHTLLFNYTVAKKFGKDYAWSVLTSGVEGDPWVGVNGVYDVFGNAWIVGDRSEARLGALSEGFAAQYSAPAEQIWFTPFTKIEKDSIDEMEIETVPGFTFEDVNVFASLTYDGQNYGKEWSVQYGGVAEWDRRFIARRLGYVSDWFALKLRTVTPYRIAFCRLVFKHG